MAGKISGFYYDEQLVNPLTSVSVYTNMKYDKSSEEFKPWYSENDLKNLSKNEKEELDSTLPNEGSDKFYYGDVPIVSSILVDDFQIDIANNWGDAGGDPMGSLWNSFKGIAPYISKLSKTLSIISDKTSEATKNNNENLEYEKFQEGVIDGIRKTSDMFSQYADKASKFMNRSLSVQGSQFLYYSGSGISFNNLAIKFTILPEFKDNRMITVVEKVEDLLPYCIGDFKSVSLKDDFGVKIDKNKKDKNIIDKGKEVADSVINDYVHWQLPPGGFEANTKYIDFVQKGTLKLVIGSYYTIQNLAISGCSLVFSKQLVKNPYLLPKDSNFLSPLSCEVSLSFKPITKYSRKTLVDVINGKYTLKQRQQLSDKMSKSYDEAYKYYNPSNSDKPDYYV